MPKLIIKQGRYIIGVSDMKLFQLQKQMSESIQKCKVHNFYQSVHCLPFNESIMTTDQLNRNILLQSSNLYSLFDLIVSVANHQSHSDKPISYYRRLMMLIYCICTQYELYFSKLKALVRFWWESSLKARSYAHKIYNPNQCSKIEHFRQKLNRDDFVLQTLKCFSILLKQINLVSKQKIKQNQLVRDFIIKAVDYLEEEMKNHQEQTEYRIPLAFEYSGFLLLVYPYRKQKRETEKLFIEFWKSILGIIRVLKKFYNHSTPQHREKLSKLISNGRVVFGDDIPIHKLNMLTSIISYVERNQQNEEKHSIKPIWDEKHKKIIIIISRILAQWKTINLHLSSGQTIQANKPDKKRQRSIEKTVVHDSTFKKSASRQKLKKNKENGSTFRKIHELKRKRFVSTNFSSKQRLYSMDQLQIKDKLPDLAEKPKNMRQRLHSAQIRIPKNKSKEGFPLKETQIKPNIHKGQWIPRKNEEKTLKLKLIRK